MLKNIAFLFLIFLCAFACTDCKNDKKTNGTTPAVKPPPPVVERTKVRIPKFETDTAYTYIEKQVSFGARVPNTEPHRQCRDWMIQKMKSFGAVVIAQDFEDTAYTGELYQGTNVIAQFNPDRADRIMLCAHWDSRHISDNDPIEENRTKPVMGADDGGSGVGVLMEIARHLQNNPIEMGVDIIFFDLEDNGESNGGLETTWCLGSQYWANNIHRSDYNPKYGILLDMVGAKDARFTLEGVSMRVAPELMRKIWKLGQGIGYRKYFVNEQTDPIVDDHLFVNRIARIPTIDIINRPRNYPVRFMKCWHTQCDDITNINKSTLQAIGQTVLATVYKENNGNL